MASKYVITGISGLLLGAVGGGISGYTLASGGGSMRGKHLADVTTADHRAESRPVETALDTSSMSDQFGKIVFPFVPFDEGCDIKSFISWFHCRSYELNHESGGLHIAVGHPLVHDPDFSNIRFKYSAHNLSPRQVLDEFSKQTGINYSIRPCVVLWERRKTEDAADGKTPEDTQPPN